MRQELCFCPTDEGKETYNMKHSTKDEQAKDSNLKTKSKLKLVWTIISGLLIAVLFIGGLVLMFNEKITSKVIDSHSQDYIRSAKIAPDNLKANEEKEVSYDTSNVRAINSAELLEEFVKESNHFADLPVIGGIAIPEVGMNLPIFKGLDNSSLAVGAGTAKPNQSLGTGNFALASHSLFYGAEYDGLLFKPLHKVNPGMKIYARDASNIYEYTTTRVFVVDPDAGHVIDDSEGDKMITLITCTDDAATQRLIVRGELSASYPIDKASKEITNFFGSDWTRFY